MAERRGRAVPEALPDPIGRLDDVLATLEEMLDGHGVPPPPAAPVPAARETPAPDPGEPGTLPLLEDMVAPAANGRAEDAVGVTGGPGAAPDPEAVPALDAAAALDDVPGLDAAPGPDAGPEAEGAAAPLAREPLPLGFEFIPDDPLPRIGDLDLGPLDGGPGGERYGDAPPALDPEVYRHLIDRLANEIDVIIQTGTEEAMERAAAEIAARVREHVAIILPEVIEELVRMSGREPD